MICIIPRLIPSNYFYKKIWIMFDNLDKEQIENVIAENIVGRLGCHADDKTYVVPVSYAYDGKCIYVRTFEGLKISMMRKNPNVCFQVDSFEDMADWKSVFAWGVFEELTDEEERNEGLRILINRILPGISSETMKLSPTWPFPTEDYSKIVGIVFRIRLTEKTGRCEKLDPKFYRK
jgi:nitroimidazol reductase NimA-like FMN-containing flavoprotein (pyridoxamine 5'-phosphate oxidase superfamily)